MSPLSLSEGNTVRCTHDTENLKDRLGTVTCTDIPRASRSNTHVRVAFIGHDRETVVPIDWIELVTDVSANEMIDKWQEDMDQVSMLTDGVNRDYDAAPDGSVKKQNAVEKMEHLSRRRSLIESAFTILVDLVP